MTSRLAMLRDGWVVKCGALASLGVLLACPNPIPEPVDPLIGTWSGQSVEADALPAGSGGRSRVELVIASGGQITSVRLNGQPSGTGLITREPGGSGAYSYVLSNGSGGQFYLGPVFFHAAMVDVDGTLAVLQRGGSALPSYLADDVVGTWAGRSIFVDAAFTVTDVSSSQATFTADGALTGIESGQPFASTAVTEFTTAPGDATLASWSAPLTSPALADGTARFVMSPDKQFLAGVVLASNATLPSRFSVPQWLRQQ